MFDLGDRLLMVATDRISAFDCILPTGIPQKGEVLNRLSAWWFERTAAIVPNHVIALDPAISGALRPFADDVLRGRSMLVKKARPLPVECVVRGSDGSGWKDYNPHGPGLRPAPARRLPAGRPAEEPLFTPARARPTRATMKISSGKSKR